jgi:hypothetical protein
LNAPQLDQRLARCTQRCLTVFSQRIGPVEPVSGNIRPNERLNRFTLRGSKKVGTHWRLDCLLHNQKRHQE